MAYVRTDPKPADAMRTDEATAAYTFDSFLAPFVLVYRNADGVKGTLEFANFFEDPEDRSKGFNRYYFGFVAA